MPFATQTREVGFLMQLFRRLRQAEASHDYAPVERMIDPSSFLRTEVGIVEGRKAVLQHLRRLQAQQFRMEIVAPKGGLITVLVSDRGGDAEPSGSRHEQVYRVADDHLLEIIDLGRTPEQVHRPESQPN